jgi:hypothetical protein
MWCQIRQLGELNVPAPYMLLEIEWPGQSNKGDAFE